MKKLWCSIWRAFLNAFTDAVDGVAYAVDTLTPPVLNLLSGVGDVAGDVIGSVGGALNEVFGGSPLLWIGVGVFAFMLLKGGKDESNPSGNTLVARDNSSNRPVDEVLQWT